MSNEEFLNDIQTDGGLLKHSDLVRLILTRFVEYGRGRDQFNAAVDRRCTEDCEEAIANNHSLRDSLDEAWDTNLSGWHSSFNRRDEW